MTLAATFPLLDTFLTILWVFLFILWIWLVISVFIDIFASHDMGGFSKVLWMIVILIFPFFGVLVYMLLRGPGMTRRRNERAARADQDLRSWYEQTRAEYQQGVREGSASVADELHKLADLRDRGVITEDEFSRQKERLLS